MVLLAVVRVILTDIIIHTIGPCWEVVVSDKWSYNVAVFIKNTNRSIEEVAVKC